MKVYFLDSKQAQRCYCDTTSCSGWIGADPDKIVESNKRGLKKKRDDYSDVSIREIFTTVGKQQATLVSSSE